jgi:hypothetical protein
VSGQFGRYLNRSEAYKNRVLTNPLNRIGPAELGLEVSHLKSLIFLASFCQIAEKFDHICGQRRVCSEGSGKMETALNFFRSIVKDR